MDVPRQKGSKINKVFERDWRIACYDSGNNSENNSENNSVKNFVNNYCNPNKSLAIHQPNLQLLMIEIFNTKNNLNPTFMKDIYTEKIAFIIDCEIQIICNCRKKHTHS